MDITKSVILAVKNASSKRQEALKKKKTDEDKEANRKKRAVQQIKELKDKKRKLIENVKEEAEVLDADITSLTNA